MKKILCILVVVAIFFVSCVSTEVALKEDSPVAEPIDKTEYFDIRWASIGSGLNTNINFKTVGDDRNVILELEYLANNTILVGRNHKVILTFDDGKILKLYYDERVSKYTYNSHKIVATLNSPLKSFGTLKTAKIETEDEYINVPVTDKEAKRLIRLFNEIKKEV